MTPPPVPLHHRHQPEPWGCAYHATFALTGDETLLEHVRDANPQRFAAHLAERGILRRTLYNCLWSDPVPPMFWERLLVRVGPQGQLPLIVWHESNALLAEHHAVALVLRGDGHVWVSDSKRPGIEEFSMGPANGDGTDPERFYGTRYARAREVTQLVPSDLSLYKFQDALEVMEARL